MKKYKVEYSHNNSGGRDWLTKDHWDKLLSLGWTISSGYESYIYSIEKTFEAKSASKAEDKAREEWSEITGQYGDEEGCKCCGPPHSFYTSDV